MNFFKTYFSKIERIGVREGQTEQQQGAIKQLNLMCLLIATSTLFFALIFFIIGYWEVGLMVLMCALVYGVVFWLQHREKYMASRILVVTLINVAIVFFSMVFPDQYQFELAFFVYCGLQILIFDIHSTRQILILFFIGLVAFILVAFPILPNLDLAHFDEDSSDVIPDVINLILFIIFWVEMWLIFPSRSGKKQPWFSLGMRQRQPIALSQNFFPP
jgi:hypothetical protein